MTLAPISLKPGAKANDPAAYSVRCFYHSATRGKHGLANRPDRAAFLVAKALQRILDEISDLDAEDAAGLVELIQQAHFGNRGEVKEILEQI